MVLKGFFANINTNPKIEVNGSPGGGAALHGITQLLGQVVKLAAKNPIFLLKNPSFKSYFKNEILPKKSLCSFYAGSLLSCPNN